MLGSVAKKLFGSRNDRLVKSYSKIVKQINGLEEQYKGLTDDQLKAKTAEFRERLAKGDYVYRQNVVTNSLSDLVLGSTASIITSTIMIICVLVIMSARL